jgi:hypothetical protein
MIYVLSNDTVQCNELVLLLSAESRSEDLFEDRKSGGKEKGRSDCARYPKSISLLRETEGRRLIPFKDSAPSFGTKLQESHPKKRGMAACLFTSILLTMMRTIDPG